MKKELSTSKIDTSKVMLMVELVDQYKYANADSALLYAQKALILSRNIKFHEGEFRSLLMMGFALSLANNHALAMEVELKALRIAEKYHFSTGRGEVLSRLGVIYRGTKEFSRALFYLKQSKQLFDSLHNHYMAVVPEVQLGRTYYAMDQPDSALYYCLMADSNIRRYGADFMSCANLIPLGRLQSDKGNVQLALNYYRQCLLAGYSNGQYFFTITANLEIAEIYQKQGQTDSCIYYAQRALDDAQKNGSGSTIAETSLFLSALYEKTNLALALQYQKMALAAIKKQNSFGNLNTIQNLAAFDEEERQSELAVTEAAYQDRVKQYALMTGLVLFLLIAFFLYRNNKQKKQANELLSRQKEEIHTQKLIAEETLSELRSTQSQLIQSEKMASLGELTAGIAHEIQNPLNFVNNFSEVSTELVKEMVDEVEKGNSTEVKAIANDLVQNLEKINHHGKRADAIVKGMLQHSRSSNGVKEPTDINALCDEYLRLSYHGLRAKDKSFNATIKTDFDPSVEYINIIPQDLGRVVLNLLTNAFYAVAEKKRSGIANYEPTVIITTKRSFSPGAGWGEVIIKVTDNGNGIPQKVRDKIFQPFFTTKPAGQGTGLGLSLSYDIITKGHGGELKVETK
ncbi:MAG TPA: ATP-binding protein, partial [Ferruginibacter sp.]|nr:ATP-binding protein [Ferruginibacter sp.]